MIPAPFDYILAEHPDHALELLGKREDAKILAGGHSLLPAMKLRLARPELLIDVGRIGGLSYVREDGDAIAIGALTRHKDVAESAIVRTHCPIVASVAGQVGDPQVRHRGTIGGSIAHGDPASDLPSVLLALEGEVVARSRRGAGDRRDGPVHGRVPDRARTRRAARRGPRAEARLGRLVVREDESPRPGLGDGGRRRRRQALERLGGKDVDRAHEHGCDVAPCDCGRAGTRGGRVAPMLVSAIDVVPPSRSSA